MHDVTRDEVTAARVATLTNGVPPRRSSTTGVSRKPWNRDNPGGTPPAAKLTPTTRDLGVSEGIGGTLSSHGTFGDRSTGSTVHGETDTSELRHRRAGGRSLPLHTNTAHRLSDRGTQRRHARLERIDADFLEAVAGGERRGPHGPRRQQARTVSLTCQMTKARIEDVMVMAMKAVKLPMVGALTLTTKFLPPRQTDSPSD